jgi:predicted Zn-dependent peptidase
MEAMMIADKLYRTADSRTKRPEYLVFDAPGLSQTHQTTYASKTGGSVIRQAIVSTCVALLVVFGHDGRTQPPVFAAPDVTMVDVREVVLDNGFRLLVVQDSHVHRVAASLWYRFGSIAEVNGEHGSAHFLEHAIHQGTTTVGTTDFEAEKPILREIYDTEQQLIATRNRERNRMRERNIFYDEFDWPTTPEMDQLRKRLYELEDRDAQYRDFWAEFKWYQRYGYIGRHTDPVPATTSTEHLEIDIDLPTENIELFFRLEADRMANAVLRGWEAQRFTVMEQILNRQGRPETGRFYEVIDGATGIVHPIYESPGGHFRDYAHFTRANMLRFYDNYFVPNNATLVLVGDISMSKAQELAARYFGRIPRGPEPPAQMDVEAEPPPGGAIRVDWSEPLEPRVLIRYRVPGVGHPDRPAFDLVAAALRGQHGMLAARLKGQQGSVPAPIEIRASASRNGSPNTITFMARARRDADLPALEQAMLDVIEEVRQGRIDAAILGRARKALRLEWAQVRGDRGGLAYQFGSFQNMDSWKTLQPFLAERERVSVEGIQRVAQRYLVPWNRVIATSRSDPRPAAPADY